jgi:hypothetical protein
VNGPLPTPPSIPRIHPRPVRAVPSATGHRPDRAARLTDAQRRQAARELAKATARNPLRRVRLSCRHLWIRDPVAVLHDWMWCDRCADNRRVTEVVE